MRYNVAVLVVVLIFLFSLISVLGNNFIDSNNKLVLLVSNDVKGVVKDEFIWHTAYYYKNDEWQTFELPGDLVEGKWIKDKASFTLTSQELPIGENSLIFYSCFKSGENWDCGAGPGNEGKWRIKEFNFDQKVEQQQPEEVPIKDKDQKFEEEKEVQKLYAYANTYDIDKNKEETITLYSNSQGDYIITELPRYGVLKKNDVQINSVPYTIKGNTVTYTSNLNYLGPDSFTFNVEKDGKIGTLAPILLSVVEPYDLKLNVPGNWIYKIPEITDSRWLSQPPYPAQRQITKQEYLDFIEYYYYKLNFITDARVNKAGKKDFAYQDGYALTEAFLYQVYKQSNPKRAKEHFDWAMKLLHGNYLFFTEGPGKDWDKGSYMWLPKVSLRTYPLIKDSPLLTPKDKAFLKIYFFKLSEKVFEFKDVIGFEYGAHNRAFRTAIGLKAIAQIYPDVPRKNEIDDYYNLIWDEWFTEKGFDENTDHYNSIFLEDLMWWIDFSGKQELYNDPGVKALYGRFFDQITPFGTMSQYGSGNGFNAVPGTWIALLENHATVYNDKEKKWLAHRMFEWMDAQRLEMWEWGNEIIWMAEYLIPAYLVADDNILELQPSGPSEESLLTYSKAVDFVSKEESKSTKFISHLTDEIIFNKLILRSGYDEKDMFALIELSQPQGHGHCDTGSVNMLADGGSILLTSASYQIYDQRFHNTFQLGTQSDGRCFQRADDLSYLQEDVRSKVEDFSDNNLATHAKITITNYQGHNAEVVRRVFFIKNKFMWVLDTLTVNEDIPSAQIGPAWNTGAIYGAKGDNWANTAFNKIPLPYLNGDKYMMQWQNYPRDLLVMFPSIDDNSPPVKAKIDYVGKDQTRVIGPSVYQNAMRYRLWDKKVVDLKKDDSFYFNSLLVPHDPNPDVSSLVNSFELIVNEPKKSVLKQTIAPNHEIWIGFNELGGTITVGSLQTDAPYFVVEIKDGKIVNQLIPSEHLLNLKQQFCGDGITQQGEQCDDQNSITEKCSYGSSSCQVCTSTCQVIYGKTSYCGDGFLDEDNDEQCDDKNNQDKDGCSASCLIEYDYKCAGMPSNCKKITCLSPPANLITWLPADKSAEDIVGKHSVKFQGTFADGLNAEAFNFDGVNNYLEIKKFATDFSEGTISFWINPSWNGNDGKSYILFDHSGGSPFWLGKTKQNSLLFFWNIGGGKSLSARLTDSSMIVANNWYHIVVRWNKNQKLENSHLADIKINMKYSANYFGDNFGKGVPAGNFYIGKEGQSIQNGEITETQSFRGKIDELGIWNRALTFKEIQEIYEVGDKGLC